jgi:ComF family protein
MNFQYSFLSIQRNLSAARSVLLGQACAACNTPCVDAPICKGCTLSLVKSPRCPRCAIRQATGVLCGGCASKPPAFDATVCIASFADPLAGLVAQLKFEKRLVLAQWFASQLKMRLNQQLFDAVVPVPLHPLRLQTRGFNQAACIATHLPYVLQHALERLRDTPSQRSVTASQRLSNVKGAFAANKDLTGQHLLLVDDVVTTTATVQAASLALKKAGAASVTVACVARVD